MRLSVASISRRAPTDGEGHDPSALDEPSGSHGACPDWYHAVGGRLPLRHAHLSERGNPPQSPDQSQTARRQLPERGRGVGSLLFWLSIKDLPLSNGMIIMEGGVIARMPLLALTIWLLGTMPAERLPHGEAGSGLIEGRIKAASREDP